LTKQVEVTLRWDDTTITGYVEMDVEALEYMVRDISKGPYSLITDGTG
jgi:hypothetical protein